MKRQIEIVEGLFLQQPMESFSVHLDIDLKENLIHCVENWGQRPKDLSKFVKKLMKLQMIQPSITDQDHIHTDVNVWEIGDNSGLFIETYHHNLTRQELDMCEHDRTMSYEEFVRN